MKFRTSLLVLIFLFLFTSVVFANSEKVATVEEVIGDVFVIKGAGKVEYRAKAGMNIYQGDSLRTGKNSLVKINFGDGDVTTLGENGKITIAELSETNDTGGNGDFKSLATKKKVTVKQESGKTWTKVKNLLDSGKRHKVETATAVMGVRGTLFLTEILANESVQVSVIDGEVAVDLTVSDHQEEHTVSPGQQYIVLGMTDQSAPINFSKLFNEVQPEMGAEIIQDTIAEVEAKVEEAAEILKALEKNPNETLARQSMQTIAEAELMVTVLERMLHSVNVSSNSEAIKNMLPENITELIENANQLFDRVRTMKQQMEQMIEQQLNIPMNELEQNVDELRKIMEDVIIENPIPTNNEETRQTPTTSDDDSGSTSSPSQPSTGGGLGPGDQSVPSNNEGTGITFESLSRDEVIQLRGNNTNVIGGIKVKITDLTVENAASFTVRNSASLQSYTRQQLMPKQGEELVNIEEAIFQLLLEQKNLNYYTVIFYDEAGNPILYHQRKFDALFYDKPTAQQPSYSLNFNGSKILLKLMWNEPLIGSDFTYKIYESNERINDFSNISPKYTTNGESYEIENPTLSTQPKYYYIVAENQGVRSEPLEIVVVYEPTPAITNKMSFGVPKWIPDEEEVVEGIKYEFSTPIDFLYFDLNDVGIGNIDYIKFIDHNNGETLTTINYFENGIPYVLNLKNVGLIEVGFSSSTSKNIADFSDFQFGAYMDAQDDHQTFLSVLSQPTIDTINVRLNISNGFFNNIKIYTNGSLNISNVNQDQFSISGLIPGQENVITFYGHAGSYIYVEEIKVVPLLP